MGELAIATFQEVTDDGFRLASQRASNGAAYDSRSAAVEVLFL